MHLWNETTEYITASEKYTKIARSKNVFLWKIYSENIFISVFYAPGSYITHDATWLPVYSEIVAGNVLK